MTDTEAPILKVSFSRVNLWRTCPEKFRRRYLLSEDDGMDPLYKDAGVIFHRAVEQVTNRFKREIVEGSIREQARDHPPAVAERALSFVKAFEEFLSDRGETEVVARELELVETWVDAVTGRRVRFHGFVDEVSRNADGLTLLDWKTGRKTTADQAQLHVYAPFVERILGEPVTWLQDVYLSKGGKYKVQAFKPQMDMSSVRDILTDMAHQLYLTGYYPPLGGLSQNCDYCGFRATCIGAGLASTDAV